MNTEPAMPLDWLSRIEPVARKMFLQDANERWRLVLEAARAERPRMTWPP